MVDFFFYVFTVCDPPIENNNPVLNSNESNIEQSNPSDSLQYSLDTIKFATRNFSMDNKLGEGGFGAVYKVLYPEFFNTNFHLFSILD